MKIVYIAITILVIIGFGHVVGGAIERGEIGECQKWQKYGKEMADFYLADWQVAQCAHHGITF